MRLGLITDLHWMAKPPAAPAAWHNPGEFAGVLDRVQLALEHFAERRADLVVASGDFAHHGDLDSIASSLRSLAAASAPVLVVSGNHDVADDERLLERALHTPPSTESRCRLQPASRSTACGSPGCTSTPTKAGSACGCDSRLTSRPGGRPRPC